MGLNNASVDTGSIELLEVFPECYNLNITVLIPAALIIVLALFKVNVKIAMTVSIAAGVLVSLFLQEIEVTELLRLLITGFKAENETLAVLMNGGGLVSMLKTSALA